MHLPLRYEGQNDVKISHTGRYAVFDSGLRVYRYDFVTQSLVNCNWPHSNTAPSIDDTGTQALVGTAKGLYVCHFPDGTLVARVDVFPRPAWTYQVQFEPAMSGDGQVVAYRGRNRGRFALFATVLSTGTATKIAELGPEDSPETTVMFSRDGTKLAYSDAQGRIWLASNRRCIRNPIWYTAAVLQAKKIGKSWCTKAPRVSRSSA
jgi:hypothetical protein